MLNYAKCVDKYVVKLFSEMRHRKLAALSNTTLSIVEFKIMERVNEILWSFFIYEQLKGWKTGMKDFVYLRKKKKKRNRKRNIQQVASFIEKIVAEMN